MDEEISFITNIANSLTKQAKPEDYPGKNTKVV